MKKITIFTAKKLCPLFIIKYKILYAAFSLTAIFDTNLAPRNS